VKNETANSRAAGDSAMGRFRSDPSVPEKHRLGNG